MEPLFRDCVDLHMTSSALMFQYRELEVYLRLTRAHNAFGSSKEDPILEQMAHLWWQLSDRERDILDEEGSTCNPNLRQPIGLTK